MKFWVLNISADLVLLITKTLQLHSTDLLLRIQDQALNEDLRHQSLGWIIYYPTYLLLHVLFIYFLFATNLRVRNWIILGLLSFVLGTIMFWLFFKWIGQPEIGDFFRLQFRKLFGLPFILLIIEGGRILYKDLIILNNQQPN